jgi:uncharacterized protein (TIGR03437 family)
MRLRTSIILFLAVAVAAVLSTAQISVVNGASFAPGKAIAPGSIASIFGQNLCRETVQAQWVGEGQLPMQLGGCSVEVNGHAVMLHFVSQQQINFHLPPDTPPGRAEIRVRNENQVQAGFVNVEEAAPAVFATNSMGLGEGAILHGTLWQRGPFSVKTGGQPTILSIFATGLDLNTTPVVTIGGLRARVHYAGLAPGFLGLHQINVELPAEATGAGCVPVGIQQRDRLSNPTEIDILPNDDQMQGMPGWGPQNKVRENQARGQTLSALAYNPVDDTAIVSDEEDDVIRVISLATKSVVATIDLPEDSDARAIAVNAAGTLAAAPLSKKAAVALVDLATKALTVIPTNHYPCRAAFHGNDLLVTNGASGTLSIIDTATKTVKKTVNAEFGACGLGVVGSTAVVANLQSESVSLVNLINYAVTTIDLEAGFYPKEVAVSSASMKAVITLPLTNAFLILDLASREVQKVETEAWSAIGPGSVVANGGKAYIANQMSASVTVADLLTAKVITTFPVDPGPRDLALNSADNQLLVLSEATGSLALVNLSSYTITDRILATSPASHGQKGPGQ